MGNQYYLPGQGRAAGVEDLFGRIAHRYDLINDLQSLGLHRIWKRRLITLARVQAGERAVDLCCGTGDIAFRLAARGAEVFGLDFSAPMLQAAVARGQKLGSSVQFMRGDAQCLPFEAAQFDAVTVAYGLRNLTRWEQGLAEMHRVAKPGGRLVVLDFGKPDCPSWRWIYFQYLRWLVPLFGRVFCGNSAAYAYILESLQHFPAQHGVAAQMQALQCQEIKTYNLLGGIMGLNFGIKS